MSSVVDKIPEGWVEKTLGEVVTFQRGFDLPKKDRKEGLFPLLVSNGQDGTHIEYKVKGPGIVTGRSGSLGNVFLSELDFWPLNTTLWIKNFHKNNVKYCYYFLKTFPFERYNSGSGVPTLNRNHIHPILVKIPKDLQEQKAIAQVLTAFDDKIENLQAQNQTLETLAQTIFAAWFLPSRQAGGKYQVGDELPEGWRVGKLSEVAKLKSGYAFKSKDFVEESNFKAIKIKDLKGNGKISLNDISSVSQEITKLERVQYFKLNEGDILLAMSGNTTGKIGIMPSSENEIYLNQRVGKFFMKQSKYNSFLYNFLMSGSFEEKILAMGYGSAQPNISPSQIENIDVVYPDDHKMMEFSNISGPIFKKVLKNTTQIQSLAKTRDTLLPKLMSGELRVEGFGG
ncbi:restriction endonuclease subunit S [Aequorivita sp. 609]|uniref:restriction endonuclease subunit S n=1 Tax=Aequorivita TaxID=153265 RepID=UPI00161D418D|nr:MULTISPECIES: restriction endonuclease subunit S [Aequorivita]MBB6681212.1 restriction endonuclease subunit S [Aequorivita sp. 609]